MMSLDLSDVAILNIHGPDYRCIIGGISQREAINLMQFIDLSKKAKHYKTCVKKL